MIGCNKGHGVYNNSMYGRPTLRAARCASRTSFRRVMLGPLCVAR